LTGLLPNPYAWKFAQLERYGLMILVALLILVPMTAEAMGMPFNPLASVLWPPVQVLYQTILTLAGLA
jgi:hypothetical protein